MMWFLIWILKTHNARLLKSNIRSMLRYSLETKIIAISDQQFYRGGKPKKQRKHQWYTRDSHEAMKYARHDAKHNSESYVYTYCVTSKRVLDFWASYWFIWISASPEMHLHMRHFFGTPDEPKRISESSQEDDLVMSWLLSIKNFDVSGVFMSTMTNHHEEWVFANNTSTVKQIAVSRRIISIAPKRLKRQRRVGDNYKRRCLRIEGSSNATFMPAPGV